MSTKDWEKYWSNHERVERWKIPDKTFYEFVSQFEFNNKKVLDVGAGLGRHSIYCAKNGASVIGFDSNERAIDEFTKLNNEECLNINIALSGFEYLDQLENESFDYVIAWNVVYHYSYEEITALIKRIKTKIMLEGKLLITFNSVNNISFNGMPGRKNQSIKKLNEDGSSYDTYYCDKTDLVDLLHGFDILSVKESEEQVGSRKFEGKWHWYVMAEKI
jgi:tellurite methyltransferase